MALPRLLSIADIRQRLETIFPTGISNRAYLTRDMAARVVFSMLYIGAVEGENRWLGPKHVYCMSNAQAAKTSDASRTAYGEKAWRPGYVARGKPWYADTTREPIRDETLREGLVRYGAAVQKDDVPTTSGRPRYCLRQEFSALFHPDLIGTELTEAVARWQISNLDAMALARIQLLQRGAATLASSIPVTLPNGSIRQLAPGPSSLISKAVVETFAPTFLHKPAVVLLSESGNRIVAQDEHLSRSIRLQINAAELLPDIVLFDLEPRKELLVFVEVVATAGPISKSRREALLAIAKDANIGPDRIAFVTAYEDRDDAAFKKTFGAVAWNSFVWFLAEPGHIVALSGAPNLASARIFDLLR